MITADHFYMIMPKEIHREMTPVLSGYAIPVLVGVGIMVAGTIKVSIVLYQKLVDEHSLIILLVN